MDREFKLNTTDVRQQNQVLLRQQKYIYIKGNLHN